MTQEQLLFQIKGMDCAGCARTVETGVAKLSGIQTCELNFTTETLRVSGAIDATTIISRVQALGFEAKAKGEKGDGTEDAKSIPTAPVTFWQFVLQRRDARLALIAFLLVLPGLIFHELLPQLDIHSPWIDATSVLAMVLAGYPVAQSAWRSLRINHEININVLMTIAAVGAVVIGAYTEAGVVMVLFIIGEMLEGFTAERARNSIRSLMSVAPKEATRITQLGDHSHEDVVSIHDLNVGDSLIIKPGERIPMDGRITSGDSSINQAPITGESRLIPKSVGDQLFASSINGEGVLTMDVTHLAEDNTISRLIKMVEEAQEKRAPAQRFVDQFAKYYTPAVVAVAVLVAIIPPLFFEQLFYDAATPEAGWLYRALTLLVVACPCALVISTPVSIVSAISSGARQGVLFKGGAYVEALSRVQAIAFDKTGTLTKGEPSVVRVRALGCDEDANDECHNCNDLLALASAVESRSEHPLATAVVEQATAQGVQMAYPAANDVQAIVGRGIVGTVNGRSITIGSHRHFDNNVAHDAHCDLIDAEDAQGYTTMLVSADDDYQGYIALADTVRDSSRHAISKLKAIGMQDLVMITGDNEMSAAKVSEEVGVTDYIANCLPEDKVTAVQSLLQKHGNVAMIGDGINDAPALATASVGIAIGNTAQAMETADVALMSDDLRQLPFAVRLSRAAMSTIRANVAFSIGIKLLFLGLVLVGWGSLWLAVLADVGTSLLVTANGMRLLKKN